ncbi:NAD(P)-dependent oxidoreductase [Patescibacteria group bacterium]|nr:NAD(P)-dependent oxidoreductase [Patescibacteria group bacterium]
MPILILGAQGNLGSQLIKTFSEDYKTVAWDREDFDVLDFELLENKILELKPRLIINTVAFNAVDLCESKEGFTKALKLNADLVGVLGDIALKLSAVLIHYSSDYVFNGTEEKQFFLESETPNPINKYGETKFAGELELKKRAIKGLNYYLIRTSKLFGPAGTSLSAKPSFFDIMLELGKKGGELTVVKEELSCFTYTPDLARSTKRLWELKVPFGEFHLINEGPLTWHEAALEFFALKKIPVKIKALRSEDLLRIARRPKFSVLKNTKVKKLRSFSQALIEYIEFLNNK